MVDFIRKRLQVFVSSTYEDLKQERQAAVEAILSAGHIPAGMELFAAGDESQMDVIKQWINESDIYLLILGGRYGSVEPKSGKSYVQLEYEYALNEGKPLFACLIEETALDNRVKAHGRSVLEAENPQKLKKFRTEVLTRMSKYWADSKDIKIVIVGTLVHLARRDDLVGWVRPTREANMPALVDEMARLSNENALLRTAIEATKEKEERINGLTPSEIRLLLRQKELIGYIRMNLQKLIDGTLRLDSQLAQLVFLGIVDSASGLYTLTQRGREIINRLEFEMCNPKIADRENAL